MTTPTPAGFGVFDTTIDAVYRLIPEADRVTDPNNSTLPTPITEDTIAAWITELSDMLSSAIGEWVHLTGPVSDRVKAAARAAVANGAASYVEAARYPTLAGTNDSSYGGVLWARYLAMTATIAGFVTHEIGDGGDDVIPEPDGDLDSGSPFAAFPPTYFTDLDPTAPWVEPVDPTAVW